MPGLSSAEAVARLARDGPNVLPEQGGSRRWALLGNVLREPMLLLLGAAAAIYMLLGDPCELRAADASVVRRDAVTVYQSSSPSVRCRRCAISAVRAHASCAMASDIVSCVTS